MNKGQLSIARVSGSGTRNNQVNIEIRDAVNNRIIFSGYVEPEAFGLAVTGMSSQPIEFEIVKSGLSTIGLKKETKRVTVEFTEQPDPDEISAIVADNEIDGWIVDTSPLLKFTYHGGYKNIVHFSCHRFVDPASM